MDASSAFQQLPQLVLKFVKEEYYATLFPWQPNTAFYAAAADFVPRHSMPSDFVDCLQEIYVYVETVVVAL
jgi:hypothetical protein